jgi:NTE family protein
MKKAIFFLSLFSFHYVLAQTPATIKNLVFEAAGIRGIAYCGAIEEMESKKMMNNIEKVAGTSSGAITALAVSLGYSGKEIEKMIAGTNFKKFNDGKYLFVGGINRMNKYFGWYRGKRLEKWLGKIIEERAGRANMTFEEMHQQGFRDLYVTGTCLNKQQPVIFSYETYPKMKVKDAIRISTSIPLYFEAVFMDSAGSVINHPKQTKGLDIMVDGGFMENFPIHIFDKTTANPFTIGFRIDSDAQIKNDKENKNLSEIPIGNLKQYFTAFYNIIIEDLNRQQLTDYDWQRTVSISDGSIEPKLRRLSRAEVQILIENGKKAVQNYLNKN